MGTSLWKMCLDTEPLPNLQEPGLRKKSHVWDWGIVGYIPLPREQSPQTLIKGCVTRTTRGPHHQRTQELRTNGMLLDP